MIEIKFSPNKSGIIILAIGLIIIFIAAQSFQNMYEEEPLYPSENVTEKKMLSEYLPELEDTPMDTEVYIFKGKEEGGTSLILGGTHPNEPAGYLTSVVFLENMQVNKGKIIIIPRANSSAFTHSSPQEAYPQKFSIEMDDGSEREFRFGSRTTNPLHQWPDPDVYVHPTGQRLSGSETRNLNRSYPGREDGNLTERLALGIIKVIEKEEVDISFDLHEASPEYPVVNAVVSHEKGMDIASNVSMNMQMQDVNISLEPSPKGLRGLSHREWGDHTETLPFLLETPNPAQGRLRGTTDQDLVLSGYDRFYKRSSDLGLLYVRYDENGWPIERRVGRHVASIVEFYNTFSQMKPGKEIEVADIPTYDELVSQGLAEFLRHPDDN